MLNCSANYRIKQLISSACVKTSKEELKMLLEEPTSNKHGQTTARVAREISPYWEKRGYQVLYDHDPASETVGKVVSSFGDWPYDRNTQLSHVDIAIVEKITNKVFALIEIEETTDKPKTILGDILGVLMGEHISFGKQPPLLVDERTILAVFVKSQVSPARRYEYLCEKVMNIRPNLSTANSVIERICIQDFSDDTKLSSLIPVEIE
jgi:hypothetical protein